MCEETSKCDWVLKAMVAMAMSDGHLDDREMAQVQKIYEDCEGRPVSMETIIEAVDANNASSLRDDLASKSDQLAKAAKEEIVCAAYRVLLADNKVAGEERKQLHDLAKALNISEIHLGALLEDLTASLEAKT